MFAKRGQRRTVSTTVPELRVPLWCWALPKAECSCGLSQRRSLFLTIRHITYMKGSIIHALGWDFHLCFQVISRKNFRKHQSLSKQVLDSGTLLWFELRRSLLLKAHLGILNLQPTLRTKWLALGKGHLLSCLIFHMDGLGSFGHHI